MKMTNVTFWIDDDDWEQAQHIAAERGESLSELMNGYIKTYANESKPCVRNNVQITERCLQRVDGFSANGNPG